MSDLGTNTDQSVRYDSTADDALDRELHSIQTYVSDMLALERHIAQPLKRQIDMADTANYPAAQAITTQLHTLNGAHIVTLEQCLAELGGHEAAPLKSAWSALLGFGAATIGSVRRTKVSKNLRDDYTALNLAAISYTMLHATAVGLGDARVAALAQQLLSDYARAVMQIVQIMPEVVLQELQDDGETVQTGAAELIRQQTNAVWKNEADVTHP